MRDKIKQKKKTFNEGCLIGTMAND